MASAEVPDMVGQWANNILIWIGFGTVVGLLAKAIMPGRDPGGSFGTILMGIGGSIVGSGTLAYFSNTVRVSPLSPLGFVTATAGAFFLLFMYRLLSGKIIQEGEKGGPKFYKKARTRRKVSVVQETPEE